MFSSAPYTSRGYIARHTRGGEGHKQHNYMDLQLFRYLTHSVTKLITQVDVQLQVLPKINSNFVVLNKLNVYRIAK